MDNQEQTVYINIDDSGKLSTKETVCVYGAIVFLSKKEKDKFITQYRSIIQQMRCGYCSEDKTSKCSCNCPEIKSNMIENKDRRRIINYLKKYYLGAVTVKNDEIYPYIISNTASKGRYMDFVLRRFIKGIIVDLITTNKIDPYKPLRLILNIDEQSTKSNGYYNLKDGLEEELLHGIINFNYRKTHKPILHSKLIIDLTYQKSDKSYVVQAADMLAGLIRKKYIKDLAEQNYKNKLYDYINFKLFLP